MLKALELAGFKSFADKTRFDFPDGITVVVGPNGSGKSNIVDAMKWVLGSQSAKQLRGKDMSDVIFKGSQTRGPSGSAEVTIVFDNPDGILPVDAPEVRVTRRVYRSGEGEYLINGAAVRLKDVRDLIRGTGIGIDAYSLIEQGKVDKMLNAGAKDRRAIFEEAAGISRFKAKKVEAERRLARVQTNLTRLGDIVDEVGSRLKNLRSQASKAERYRTATDRMRELRTNLGWTDWTSLSTEIDDLDRQLIAAKATLDEAETNQQRFASQRQSADDQLHRITEQAGGIEQQRITITTAIASTSGRRQADVEGLVDANANITLNRKRWRGIVSSLGASDRAIATAAEAAQRALQAWQQIESRFESTSRQQQSVASEAAELAQSRDELNRRSIVAARQMADLESKQVRTAARINESAKSLAALAARLKNARQSQTTAEAASDDVHASLAEVDESIAKFKCEVEIASSEVNQTRRTLERRREDLADLQLRRQAVTERHRVLADLEARQEGLSGGVRAVLAKWKKDSKSGTDSLSDSIVGLVAECFDADVEIAKLVDAALGPLSQYIVVRGDAVQQMIVGGTLKIDSRVGLIRADELPPRRAGDRIRLDGLRGVIGRADRMVKFDPADEPLVRHLLSTTWLVDSIGTAIGLRKLSGAGLRFVTSAAELLENDGSVVIGPQAMATGLISRRSELSAAAKEIEHYEYQIKQGASELERCREKLDDQSAQLGRGEDQLRSDVTRRAGVAAEAKHAAAAVETAGQLARTIESELTTETTARDTANREAGEQRTAIATLGKEIESISGELADVDESLSSVNESLAAIGSDVTELSVEMARCKQDRELTRSRHEAAGNDARAHREQAELATAQWKRSQSKHREISRRIFAADDELASLAVRDEQTAAELRTLALASRRVRQENRDVMRSSELAIKQAAEATSKLHSITSKLDAAKLRRETLASRLMDDYQIDLHAAEVPEDFEPIDDRDGAETEINSLRSQLQKTTSVNMEALEELEQLQTRYDQLHGQYQDLTAAKDSLQRMIGKINADSRRLFLDTLEAIRINFQQLYRKSFGGGHADLILEDSDDPLEAGVEIVATPPGKPSFSNSLLSGGEKALTAVALLMSIFKYRPSPFCVLDEVDAPFDEANIGRFVMVLSEFLDHSKFVVVTHSKKTMTAATTLYGVTMQESGVSKQVSIRFEDVSDDGEIAAA